MLMLNAASSFTLVLMFAWMLVRSRHNAILACWIGGLLMLSFATALLAARDHVPLALTVMLANTLLAAGFAALALAVRNFMQVPAALHVATLPVVLVMLGIAVFAYVWPNYVIRVWVLTLAVGSLLLWQLAPLASSLRSREWAGQQLLFAVLAVGLVLLLARALAYALTAPTPDSLLETSPFNTALIAYLSALPMLASIAFMLAWNERLVQQTVQMATVDAQSGAHTRRALYELSGRILADARRYRRPLSVLMIDVDRFKNINETYGHPAGDRVLQEIVKRLHVALRTEDVVGRIGGEEFVAVLPATPEEEAARVAERIRNGMAAHTVIYGREEIPFSVTIGVAEREPGEADIEPLLRRASQALFSGKAGGGNRVIAASDLPGSSR